MKLTKDEKKSLKMHKQYHRGIDWTKKHICDGIGRPDLKKKWNKPLSEMGKIHEALFRIQAEQANQSWALREILDEMMIQKGGEKDE